MIKKIIFGTVLVYTLFGFFVLPYIIKSQLQNIVSTNLNATLAIQEVTFNPYTFRLSINNSILNSIDNKKIASFEGLDINLEPHSLIFGALYIKDITLQKPYFYIAKDSNNTLNIADLQKGNEQSQTQKSSEFIRVILDNLRVRDGEIFYEDYTKKKKYEIGVGDIDIKISRVDTQRADSNQTQARFNATLSDGALIDLRGNIRAFKPFKMDGSLAIEGIKIYSIFSFVQDDFLVEVADGAVDVGSKLRIDLSDINSTTIDEVNVALDNFRLKPKGNHPDILSIKSLKLNNAFIKPMQKSISVDDVLISKLDIKAKRYENSLLNWVEYIKTPNNTSASQAKEDKVWSVVLNNIALNSVSANFIDEAIVPNVSTTLNELNLNINNFELPMQKPFLYKSDFILNDKFRCNLGGSIKLGDVEVSSQASCSGLNIAKYTPYIDKVAKESLAKYNVELKSADVGFSVKSDIKMQNDLLDVKIRDSNLSVQNLSLYQRDNSKKVSGFKNF